VFFELSKIIPAIFYPLPLFFIVFYLWFVFSKREKKPWTVFTLVTILLVASTALFNDLLLTLWESPAAVRPFPKAGAIVVLGGSTEGLPPDTEAFDGSFNERADRFLWGLRLFRAGHGQFLVFSGGSGALFSDEKTVSEAEIQRAWAETLGYTRGVLKEEDSRNTHENAVNTTNLLRDRGIKDVLLVTSAFHMPRAQAIFEKQGFTVFPFPVDSSRSNLPFPANLYPEPKNLQTFHNLLKEWVGYLAYGFLSFL
jgi:uncharacterized SAM-binding protein YcdF (DUF218 family)